VRNAIAKPDGNAKCYADPDRDAERYADSNTDAYTAPPHAQAAAHSASSANPVRVLKG